MRRFLFILPLAVVVAIGLIFAVLLATDRNREIIPSVLIDQPAPATNLPALAGLDGIEGVDSTEFSDGVTIINFFASWCVPCLAEHPLITAMASDGHRVWGINYRDEEPNGLDWLNRHGNPYDKVGADFDARSALDWGVTGVPETFIVDPQGVIRYKHSGPLTSATVQREILPILSAIAAGEALQQ
jgi:cytochrome c biogenesis protein CcmG/thiol:disulfide interchange protein DsbE